MHDCCRSGQVTQEMLDAPDKRLFVGIGALEAASQLLGFIGASKLPGTSKMDDNKLAFGIVDALSATTGTQHVHTLVIYGCSSDVQLLLWPVKGAIMLPC